ncbi:MAG TPA: hypothetical protein QGF02_04365 [Candidatus Babeliales bacterium]|nr:hypothetical protein [Candidatus Babeliales bacterium]
MKKLMILFTGLLCVTFGYCKVESTLREQVFHDGQLPSKSAVCRGGFGSDQVIMHEAENLGGDIKIMMMNQLIPVDRERVLSIEYELNIAKEANDKEKIKSLIEESQAIWKSVTESSEIPARDGNGTG